MSVSLTNHEEDPSRMLPHRWFSTAPLVPDDDLSALMTDLFDWLERAWQLPVMHPEVVRAPLPHPYVLTEEVYTLEELKGLYGIKEPIGKVVQRYQLVAMGSPSRRGTPTARYRKEDLAPVIEQWEWRRVSLTLNDWWRRLFPAACQTCSRCQHHTGHPRTQQLLCKRAGFRLHELRYALTQFLREVVRAGSVSAWWRVHSTKRWEGKRHTVWGIVVIYLLDRRLLHLSTEELAHLARLGIMTVEDLTRLWRLRCAQEYHQFCEALHLIISNAGMRQQALLTLSLFVLLRYGLVSLSELRPPLSTEELDQVCREHRLITAHLGLGIFLPYPLLADIRVGHGVLDDLRFFCWGYAAQVGQKKGSPRWNQGPPPLEVSILNDVERALAAPLYEGATGIIPRRPEIDRPLVNPWRLHERGVRAQNGYAVLPREVQQQVMAYVEYCHQEQGLALATLRARAWALMHFYSWARTQGKLELYPYWDRASAHEVFRAYALSGCSRMSERVRTAQLRLLALFFETVAELEYPVPAGYQQLSVLGRGSAWQPRPLPAEEVVDRVFRDGVRLLSYDPFARAALTIQYYCGTRVTETCDLHVFCILEDQEGHAWLLIPRGKTKQERPFPIVSVGMGILLQYIDEIVALRLSSDGTSQILGRTNIRYVNDDPERGRDWHYLFERGPRRDGEARRRGCGRGRLSSARVGEALQEALMIAAKRNPTGLFQPGSGSGVCHHQRDKGQKCGYFVAQEGMTICPCCGSPLSGERGVRCQHRFAEAFRCDGVAEAGEAFCPKCDMPLAKFVPITPHVFRHNSVSRAHRAGVSLSHNMQLHGHQTIPIHLRYLHLLVEESAEEVDHIFAQKRLQEVGLALEAQLGERLELKNALPLSLEQYLCITLQRSLKRRTCGVWGGFWAGALAQRGVVSPLTITEELVIPEESYEHTVAQYWYEALGLAISEVAFEAVTAGAWRAQVPVFLERKNIDELVQFHLRVVQDSLGSPLGRKLIETDIVEQRAFLHELAELLRPWWQPLGTIERLVELFAPGGRSVFQNQQALAEVPSEEGDPPS
jgi:site-specific recombinase XerD